MRPALLIMLVGLFISSCSGKEKIPRNLIPQKKMQAVLWDLMRADQFLSDYVLNRDTSLNKSAERLKYYNNIFSIHKISRENFQHSFAYYQAHPALFKMIMDSISTPPANEAAMQPITPKLP